MHVRHVFSAYKKLITAFEIGTGHLQHADLPIAAQTAEPPYTLCKIINTI